MLKNFLLLTAFSTFVVIVIIALDVYHKIQVSSLPENTKKRIIPIPSNFDTQTLESLKTRKPISGNIEGKSAVVSEDTKNPTSPTPIPTVTITILQQVTSSDSAISQ